MRRLRPEPLIVAALVVLSAGVITASVEAASSELRRSVIAAQTEVPASLFELEPPRSLRLAPVESDLQEEAEEVIPGETPPPPRVPQPSPSPTTASRVVASPTPKPPPADVTAFEVTLVAASDSRGRHGSVRYIATVKNTGTTALAPIGFTSHVPEGMKWSGGSGCGSNGLPVEVTYDSEPSSTVCMPGSAPLHGSSDLNVHQVALELQRELRPGSVVQLAYSFEITDGSLKKVTNHVHAEASGMRVSSPDVVVEVR